MSSQIDYGRQSDICDPERARALHVTICGAGTVGSHAAVELARLGVGSLHVIDGDVVEAHNLPSQAYQVADIGRPKVEALADRIADFSDHCQVNAEQTMLYGGEMFEPGPVLLAVDSMDARKSVLELSVANRPEHPLLIDARMAGKMYQCYAFDPTGASEDSQQALDYWLSQWFPQDEALPVACGGRSVSFIGAQIGALISALVCRHLAEKPVPFMLMSDLDSFHITRLQSPPAPAE